jgi:hypothetical protein
MALFSCRADRMALAPQGSSLPLRGARARRNNASWPNTSDSDRWLGIGRCSDNLAGTLHYTDSMTTPTRRRRARFGTMGVAATLLAATATAASDPPAPGPDRGTAAPSFEAVDHNGKMQDFESLAGENGLLLLFFRSADW